MKDVMAGLVPATHDAVKSARDQSGAFVAGSSDMRATGWRG